jgi:uncharacterized protein
MTVEHTLPPVLDLRPVAHRGEPLRGQAPVARFARLSEGLPAVADDLQVVWEVRAEWRTRLAGEPVLWLHVHAQAAVPQVCQRCLQPFAPNVSVDRWFRFVADEATAAQEDDESEEDVLVLEPRFDLQALVEDELLMGLPLVPMHELCPVPVKTSAGELELDLPVEKPNPFAALAALKSRGKR